MTCLSFSQWFIILKQKRNWFSLGKWHQPLSQYLRNNLFSNFLVNGQQFLHSFEEGEKKLHCECLWIILISMLHTGVVKVIPSLPAWPTLPSITVSTLGCNYVSSDLEEKIFVDFILWKNNLFWLMRNVSYNVCALILCGNWSTYLLQEQI